MAVTGAPVAVDWTVVSGISAATMAVGAILGAVGKHMYSRGSSDGRLRGADMANAAAIVRIEMSVKDLTNIVTAHLIDDKENFTELKVTSKAMAEAMKEAAGEMRALTQRLNGMASSGRIN